MPEWNEWYIVAFMVGYALEKCREVDFLLKLYILCKFVLQVPVLMVLHTQMGQINLAFIEHFKIPIIKLCSDGI
jgi:hypothetical protein